MPPDLLMRSTAICVPTRAVLPPAAAEPESGCSVPTRYGLAWPKAGRHGAGTSIVAPSAPALAALHPINLRRVTLPLYQNSSLKFCAFSLFAIAFPPRCARLDLPGHRHERIGEDLVSKRNFMAMFKDPVQAAKISLQCSIGALIRVRHEDTNWSGSRSRANAAKRPRSEAGRCRAYAASAFWRSRPESINA